MFELTGSLEFIVPTMVMQFANQYNSHSSITFILCEMEEKIII
uniref:Uncharacterized protein n=1 Tax=Heterorhabditis bacteriophora TaxID=37862 RepID=A0A1I7WPD5_HETBA